MSGFKKFILRGNVVDLAVGVIIGAAFNSVVTALVKDLLTPIISAFFKAPDFSSLSFTINGSKFLYGDFLNTLISFIIVAFAVYFFAVLPFSKLISPESKKSTTKNCPECSTAIPFLAKRCPNCTSRL